MSSSGNGGGGARIRPGSPARQLPAVLRRLAAAKPDAVRLELGTVVAIPDAELVELDFGGGTAVVPRIAGYTPTVGEPAWCLVGASILLAIGAVGGSTGSAPPYVLPPRLAGETGGVPVTDANLAQEAGWYGLNTGALNLPTADTKGHLEVYSWSIAGNVVLQFWHAFDHHETWRRFKWGGWSGWVKVYPVDDVVLPARIRALATEPADLNTAQDSGWYYANTAANRPPGTSSQWLVHAIQWGSSGYAKQLAYGLYTDEVWSRRLYNGTWSAWVKSYPIDDTNLPPRIRANGPVVGDFNTATLAGWSGGGGGTTNGPPTSYGEYSNVLTLAVDAQQIAQLAFPYWGAEVWYRRMHSGTWQPWSRVFPAIPPMVDDTTLPARLRSRPNDGQAIGDLNLATQSGWYVAQPGVTANMPYGDWGQVFAIAMNTEGNVRQTFYAYGSDVVMMRRRKDNTWHPWVEIVSVAVADTTRKTLAGFASGTLDGNGTFRVNFGRSVVNVAAVVVCNSDTNRLNVIYSSFGFDVNGFSIYGWIAPTNAPAANQTFNVSWNATVDF